jgi:RNA polymerase sigma-70 factor (ECF subfamily)
MEARRAAERVARDSYGRLVAYLATRTRDLSLAEDALGDAFLAALRTWPERGIPPKPEAWLLTTARNRLIDGYRCHHRQEHALSLLRDGLTTVPELEPGDRSFPDERLKLLFVCAHPAIDASIHTPLMLQIVLGLTAAQIASAFLMAPSTMGQRLTRAKTKIRDAGIGFELPDPDHIGDRLTAVLEAIYAAYTVGWDGIAGGDARSEGLTEESIWLTRMAVTLLPDQPEAQGLLALLLFCEARRPARRNSAGAFVPLSAQDIGLWSPAMLDEAEFWLRAAASGRDGAQRMGRFQLEAAIQSVHVQGRRCDRTDWESLILLYGGLLQLAPTIGAWLNQVAAIAEGRGWTAGLAALNQIPTERVGSYQPYWALRGHLLHHAGDFGAAAASYQRAIGLTEDGAIREYLLGRLRALTDP